MPSQPQASFSHYSSIPPELGGHPQHNLGCGVLLVGSAACSPGRWTPAKQKVFNADLLAVLHNFARRRLWRWPPGLAIAVVRREGHAFLTGAGFVRQVEFGNPIHNLLPTPLELWTRDLNVPELREDMELLYDTTPRGGFTQGVTLQGPIGPLKFTFDLPEENIPF
jgi:hypothetical protein